MRVSDSESTVFLKNCYINDAESQFTSHRSKLLATAKELTLTERCPRFTKYRTMIICYQLQAYGLQHCEAKALQAAAEPTQPVA